MGNERSQDFSAKVIKRDRECVVCGTIENLQADHITPISEGGADSPDNGQALCANCHANKHPDMPRNLFLNKSSGKTLHAPYNASSLAAKLGCHARTVTRAARRAGIKRIGFAWSFSDKDIVKMGLNGITPLKHLALSEKDAMQETISARQVAERFDVKRSAVHNWAQGGLLEGACKDGWIWLIPVSAVENFVPPMRGRPLEGRSIRFKLSAENGEIISSVARQVGITPSEMAKQIVNEALQVGG